MFLKIKLFYGGQIQPGENFHIVKSYSYKLRPER